MLEQAKKSQKFFSFHKNGWKDMEIQANEIQYVFGNKMEFVSFQNNPKNLDPSSKMDIDLWDCLGKVKLI